MKRKACCAGLRTADGAFMNSPRTPRTRDDVSTKPSVYYVQRTKSSMLPGPMDMATCTSSYCWAARGVPIVLCWRVHKKDRLQRKLGERRNLITATTLVASSVGTTSAATNRARQERESGRLAAFVSVRQTGSPARFFSSTAEYEV